MMSKIVRFLLSEEGGTALPWWVILCFLVATVMFATAVFFKFESDVFLWVGVVAIVLWIAGLVGIFTSPLWPEERS